MTLSIAAAETSHGAAPRAPNTDRPGGRARSARGRAGAVLGLSCGFACAYLHQHAVLGARPTLFELVTPMPYAQLGQMFDEVNAFGLIAYDKTVYVEDLSDEVITVVTENLPRKTSPRSPLFIYRLDGAYCEVGEDDTAFGGGRTPTYVIFLIALADNTEMFEADRNWLRSFWAALLPHATGLGSYVNGEAEFTPGQIRSSYGPTKYQRLREIKAKYDPENAFHLNANIPPATGERP